MSGEKDKCVVCGMGSEVVFRIETSEKEIQRHKKKTDEEFEKLREEITEDRKHVDRMINKLLWSIAGVFGSGLITLFAVVLAYLLSVR